MTNPRLRRGVAQSDTKSEVNNMENIHVTLRASEDWLADIEVASQISGRSRSDIIREGGLQVARNLISRN